MVGGIDDEEAEEETPEDAPVEGAAPQQDQPPKYMQVHQRASHWQPQILIRLEITIS